MYPIDTSNGIQIGRTTVRDPNLAPAYLTFTLNLNGAEDYILDYATVDQNNIFGVARCLYFDNLNNPTNVEVSVEGSDQFFEIPANSAGIYKIDSPGKTRIHFVTVAGADSACTVTVYNYDYPPVVWYKFQSFNSGIPFMVQGTHPVGTDMDNPTDYNFPLYMAGVQSDGTLTPVLVEADGAVIVSVDQPLEVVPSPISITDFSVTNMTGASQQILAANDITQYVFFQAPLTNVGSIWINLTGGTAVVGTGIELTSGSEVTLTLGISNIVTAIAASAGDDITIYGG